MPRCTNLPQNEWLFYGEERWEIPDTGFDTAVRPYIQVGDGRRPTNSFEIGDSHPDINDMYVTGISYSYPKNSLIELDVSYKGIRVDKGIKQSARAYSNKYTTSTAFAGQPTAGLPTEISSPNLAVTESYCLEGSPDMTKIGKASTPSDAPTPPSNPFFGVVDGTFAFPDGWVLENRSYEQLAGTNIHYVTDEWVYYFTYHP